MINLHSISFRFSALTLAVSILFLVLTAAITTQLVSKQYYSLEHGKLETIVDNIIPTLSINISYGFSKALTEMAEDLLSDPNILYVGIDGPDDAILQLDKNARSYLDYLDAEHFAVEKALFDPVSKERIGSIRVVYSRQAFDTMMSDYYRNMVYAIVVYLLLLAALVYTLYRNVSPLSALAKQMESFDPEKPHPLTTGREQSRNEIGLITQASNTMIRSILSYMGESEKLRRAVLQRESHLNEAQRMAHVGSWEYRPESGRLELSQEMLRILGINRRERQSTWEDFLEFIDEDDRQYVINVFGRAMANGSTFNLKYRCRKSNGEMVDIHTQGKVRKKEGQEPRMTGISMDITEQHRSQKLIEKLAYYDPLTELPNRILFRNRLEKAIASAKRHRQLLAVLFVDLDRFKLINDSLGHMVGDELLKKVALLFQGALREEDTVSRLGGDEFTILLPMIDKPDDALAAAGKLLECLRRSIQVGKHDLHITLSMGVTFYPDHGQTADELIKNADTAMYHAKERGRNNFQVYQNRMGSHLHRQLDLEQEFQKALHTREGLCLYFQPKIDLASLKIIGAEALVRWKHPARGLLYPDSFIPLAESTGLIRELGTWVIEQSIREVARWKAEGIENMHVAINLSARQFQDDALIPMTESLLRRYDVDASQIEFEITETISMSNIQDNLLIMHQLKNLGVNIAIDDFGTGYSSLSYLKQFPVDTLKIDKSFVIDMLSDEDDKTIVSTIISMAKSLGLRTVAEGVETEAHQQLLERLSCDYAQGFYYARALEPDAFTAFARTFAKTR